MSLVPVPGFGFLEPESKKFIDDNFQIFLQEGGLAEENLTVELSDEFKCKYIVMPQWRQIFPDLSEYQPEGNAVFETQNSYGAFLCFWNVSSQLDLY